MSIQTTRVCDGCGVTSSKNGNKKGWIQVVGVIGRCEAERKAVNSASCAEEKKADKQWKAIERKNFNCSATIIL